MTTAIYRPHSTYADPRQAPVARVAEWFPEPSTASPSAMQKVRTLQPLNSRQSTFATDSEDSHPEFRTKQRWRDPDAFKTAFGGALFGLFFVLGAFFIADTDADVYSVPEPSAHSTAFHTSSR